MVLCRLSLRKMSCQFCAKVTAMETSFGGSYKRVCKYSKEEDAYKKVCIVYTRENDAPVIT